MGKIIVENLSKIFKIGFRRNQSALGRIRNIFFVRPNKKNLIALRNISFQVNPGEILGLVGKNGSGKSTLLRILAGIHNFDGKITLEGKIISLINLGTGMQYRLTMRDNIFLVGSLFGMGQSEIKNNLNSIIQFAELENFIDTQLYQFSSGMLQRLAFSIAIHTNPDILLLDEVFEIGDEYFKTKSANKIKELAKNGTSIIFVSHELWIIKKYCDRVMWLDEGEIRMIGNTKSVVMEYTKKSS